MATTDITDDDDDSTVVLNVNQDDPDDDGDAEDRGDDFTPTQDPPKPAPAAAAPAAEPPADDPDADPEPTAPGDKPKMIPIGRFNEVNEERKELLRMLAQRGGAPAPAPAAAPPPEPEFDFKAREREYTKALVEGRDEDAAELRMTINAKLGEQAEERAFQRLTATQQRDAEQRAHNELVAEGKAIRAEFPELDETGDQANARAIRFVIVERDALLAEGKSPAQALREATQAAVEVFKLGAAASVVAKPAAAPAIDARTLAARTRNAELANRQPPALSGKGERASQPQRDNVEVMSEEEFDQLSKADKKRLRGD